MKMMTGMNKNDGSGNGSFKSLFEAQKKFQSKVTGMGTSFLPTDNIHWFTYHICAMIEELGEVLRADKRWKTHRNATYEPNEKIEEIADVFITAYNLALFSNVDADTLYEAIAYKINENNNKWDNKNRLI
jgi:NTP pyrophosphatase (non-canonical NTP hydrolase)